MTKEIFDQFIENSINDITKCICNVVPIDGIKFIDSKFYPTAVTLNYQDNMIGIFALSIDINLNVFSLDLSSDTWNSISKMLIRNYSIYNILN
jgi:hypothetical protein